MKMNMMGQNVAGSNVAGHGFVAGAVAINGGVGVMEMHRPQVNVNLLPSVDDVMNSVAAVAAEIAENAHITLRELKTKIDAVTEKKLPQYKQLIVKIRSSSIMQGQREGQYDIQSSSIFH